MIIDSYPIEAIREFELTLGKYAHWSRSDIQDIDVSEIAEYIKIIERRTKEEAATLKELEKR